LLVIATTIIAGFLTFDATNFNRNVTPHWIWFKKRSISSIWKFISEFLQTKSHRDLMNRKRRRFKSKNVCRSCGDVYHKYCHSICNRNRIYV
jgi:radical SAM protein with 4Fe4S-binding SPASM domain